MFGVRVAGCLRVFGRVAGFESLGALGSLGFTADRVEREGGRDEEPHTQTQLSISACGLSAKFPGKWCLGLEGLGVLGCQGAFWFVLFWLWGVAFVGGTPIFVRTLVPNPKP